MGVIVSVRYFDSAGDWRDDEAELLKLAEHRLRGWGAWERRGNSLAELQPKSCIRPARSSAYVPEESPESEQVRAVLIARSSLSDFAVLVGIYIRQMRQQEAARKAGVSQATVSRIIRRARLLVAAECL